MKLLKKGMSKRKYMVVVLVYRELSVGLINERCDHLNI